MNQHEKESGSSNRSKLPMTIVFLLQIVCSVALIVLGATGNHSLILIGALMLILTILSRWEGKRTSRREEERPHHRKD
jgi:Flp pilus assembly protein TadB